MRLRLDRQALARYGINVGVGGNLGTPADIADVIAFLASDDARFMTGQGFFVDGGAMTRQ